MPVNSNVRYEQLAPGLGFFFCQFSQCPRDDIYHLNEPLCKPPICLDLGALSFRTRFNT